MTWLGTGLLAPILVYALSAALFNIILLSLVLIFLCVLLIVYVVTRPSVMGRLQKARDYSLAEKHFQEEAARRGGLISDLSISDDIQRVGEKITAAAGQKAGSITFCVLNDDGIGAYAYYPKYVVITMGMYRDFRNEDELVSVLAHEVGHIVRNKPKGWGREETLEERREEEYQADQLAVEFATKAGYRSNAYGQHHWRNMGYAHRMGHNIFRDDASSTHPSDLKRILALNWKLTEPV